MSINIIMCYNKNTLFVGDKNEIKHRSNNKWPKRKINTIK